MFFLKLQWLATAVHLHPVPPASTFSFRISNPQNIIHLTSISNLPLPLTRLQLHSTSFDRSYFSLVQRRTSTAMSSKNSSSNTSSSAGGKSTAMTQSDSARIQSSQVSSPLLIALRVLSLLPSLSGFPVGEQADGQPGQRRRRHVFLQFCGTCAECWRSQRKCKN